MNCYWPLIRWVQKSRVSVYKCLEQHLVICTSCVLQKYWSAVNWGLNKNWWLSPLGSLRSTAWSDAWGWILHLLAFFVVTRDKVKASAFLTCLCHLPWPIRGEWYWKSSCGLGHSHDLSGACLSSINWDNGIRHSTQCLGFYFSIIMWGNECLLSL